jgi:hypothetical protein
MVSLQNARKIAVIISHTQSRQCGIVQFLQRECHSFPSGISRNLTNSNPQPVKTTAYFDLNPESRTLALNPSCKKKVLAASIPPWQLEPDSYSGGQANIPLLNRSQLRLDFIRLNAPTEQPHQSKIDSSAQSLSKRRLRLGRR